MSQVPLPSELEAAVLAFAACTIPPTSSFILLSHHTIKDLGRTGSVDDHFNWFKHEHKGLFIGVHAEDAYFNLVKAYKENRIWFVTHPCPWIRDLVPYLEESQ